MNLKERCELDGITLAEGKEKYGLTHWKQEVPDAVQEREAEEVSVCEAPEDCQEVVKGSVATEKEEIPGAAIKLSICCLGNKSPYWNKRNLIGM